MKITFHQRKKNNKKTIDWDIKVPLTVRIVDKGEVDQKAVTPIFVVQNTWDERRGTIYSKIVCEPDYRTSINAQTTQLMEYIQREYLTTGPVPAGWLRSIVKNFYTPEQMGKDRNVCISDCFDSFLAEHVISEDGHRKLSDARRKQYLVVKRTLLRFEAYKAFILGRPFHIDLRTADKAMLVSLHEFIAKEHEIWKKNPEIFIGFEGKREPKPRSRNTMADIFKKIRCFFNWCVSSGIIDKSPFANFKFEGEKYGSIYFLKWEEVKKIDKLDLSKHPELDLARDLMLLQSGIGCRVSDLMRLKKSNVNDGSINYIPDKTIHENPMTVSVPILEFVNKVIKKYHHLAGDQLIPPIKNHQEYNKRIRQILTIAKITRPVTYLDPLTRKEKTSPINTVFSSHGLRRTFINEVYQRTGGNAELTASYTGHKTQKSFERYREISDSLKKDIINKLNF